MTFKSVMQFAIGAFMGAIVVAMIPFPTHAVPIDLPIRKVPDANCDLSDQDKVANAELTFNEIDQKGTTPSTWRQLSNRHCEVQAIEAAEDYLVHGKSASDPQRRDILFHIAQSLAMNGQNAEAALLVAGAKDGNHSKSAEFDWNTYLDGTWAFLKGNKTELKAMHEQLSAEPGDGNEFNAAALNGLLNCFDKPYAVATTRVVARKISKHFVAPVSLDSVNLLPGARGPGWPQAIQSANVN